MFGNSPKLAILASASFAAATKQNHIIQQNSISFKPSKNLSILFNVNIKYN
jgi:hypothetical protein